MAGKFTTAASCLLMLFGAWATDLAHTNSEAAVGAATDGSCGAAGEECLRDDRSQGTVGKALGDNDDAESQALLQAAVKAEKKTQEPGMTCNSLAEKYSGCTEANGGLPECTPSADEIAFHNANCPDEINFASLANVADAKNTKVTEWSYKYIGCYKDSWYRDLPVRKGNPGTHSECAASCSSYNYFGRQWSKECWCGNSYGDHGKTGGCQCDASNIGGWKNCVYKAWPKECCLCAKNFMEPHGLCQERGWGWLAHVNTHPDCLTCSAAIQTTGTYRSGDCPENLFCDTTPISGQSRPAGTYEKVTSGECSDAKVIKTKEECADAIKQLWGVSSTHIQHWSSASYAGGCIRVKVFNLYAFNDVFHTDWRSDSGGCTSENPGYATCACKAQASSLAELSAVNDTKKAATKAEAQMLEESTVRKSNEC